MEQQQRYIAPRNKKRPTNEEDDAPTYVLEGGNETITADEFKALNKDDPNDDKSKEEDGSKSDRIPGEKSENEQPESVKSMEQFRESKEKILEVGSKVNKRKAVKMVGADADEDGIGRNDEATSERKKRVHEKPNRKGKQKVKLSFQEDE